MTPWRQFASRGSSRGSGYVLTTTSYTDKYYCDPDMWDPFESWFVTEEMLAERVPEKYDMYVQDAAAKIYSNGYDALTALAELIEVRSMFLNTGRKFVTLLSEPRLRKALSRFGSLSKKKKATFLVKDLLAGNWMELRYGWRTLMYDVEDVNKTVASWNEKRTRFSERAGTTYASTERSDLTDADSIGSAVFKLHYKDAWEIGVRGSIVADVDIPKLQANIVATAWELVPLSFVVDWFVTVGKSILAASFLAKQSKYTAACGYRVQCKRQFHTEFVSYKGNTTATTQYQEAECVASLVVRRPCAVPITPHFTLNLDGYKVTDLLSIIVQRSLGG